MNEDKAIPEATPERKRKSVATFFQQSGQSTRMNLPLDDSNTPDRVKAKRIAAANGITLHAAYTVHEEKDTEQMTITTPVSIEEAVMAVVAKNINVGKIVKEAPYRKPLNEEVVPIESKKPKQPAAKPMCEATKLDVASARAELAKWGYAPVNEDNTTYVHAASSHRAGVVHSGLDEAVVFHSAAGKIDNATTLHEELQSLHESADESSTLAAHEKVLKKWHYAGSSDNASSSTIKTYRHPAGHSVRLTNTGKAGEDHWEANHVSANGGLNHRSSSAGHLDHRITGVHRFGL